MRYLAQRVMLFFATFSFAMSQVFNLVHRYVYRSRQHEDTYSHWDWDSSFSHQHDFQELFYLKKESGKTLDSFGFCQRKKGPGLVFTETGEEEVMSSGLIKSLFPLLLYFTINCKYNLSATVHYSSGVCDTVLLITAFQSVFWPNVIFLTIISITDYNYITLYKEMT